MELALKIATTECDFFCDNLFLTEGCAVVIFVGVAVNTVYGVVTVFCKNVYLKVKYKDYTTFFRAYKEFFGYSPSDTERE